MHREPLPLLVQLLMDVGQLSGRSSAGVLPTLVGNNVRNRWQQDMTQLEQGGGERQEEEAGWQGCCVRWPGGCSPMLVGAVGAACTAAGCLLSSTAGLVPTPCAAGAAPAVQNLFRGINNHSNPAACPACPARRYTCRHV